MWIDFSQDALRAIREANEKSFTVAFVSDRKMRELNKNFRGKNATTDVLSFPSANEHTNEFADDFSNGEENFLGDIIISVEQAARQSVENNLDFEMEIKQLILHGILHLCGFDHAADDGEMNRLELKYRRKLKINL